MNHGDGAQQSGAAADSYPSTIKDVNIDVDDETLSQSQLLQHQIGNTITGSGRRPRGRYRPRKRRIIRRSKEEPSEMDVGNLGMNDVEVIVDDDKVYKAPSKKLPKCDLFGKF